MSGDLTLGNYSFLMRLPTPTFQLMEDPNKNSLFGNMKKAFMDAKQSIQEFLMYAFQSEIE